MIVMVFVNLGHAQNTFFDLRTADPIYSEGAIPDLEGSTMTLTLNGISATLSANDGVLNQTTSGFGVNAAAPGDVTDKLDGAVLQEMVSISFDVEVILLSVSVSSFSAADSGSLKLPDQSMLGIGSTGTLPIDSFLINSGQVFKIS